FSSVLAPRGRNGASPARLGDARDFTQHAVLLEIRKIQGQLAPPVRVGVDRARNVGLLALPRGVFERDREQLRGGGGKEADHRRKIERVHFRNPQRIVQRRDGR